MPAGVNCVYVRQGEALGLGHAVLCARHLVGDEPFAVILADDLIDAQVPVLRQMAELHAKDGASLVAVQNVGARGDRRLRHRLDEAGEGAPGAHDRHRGEAAARGGALDAGRGRAATSSSPRIFDYLLETQRAAPGGEIQLTDAIARLLADEAVYAYEFEGRRYDCGSKLGYLEATVDYALRHKEVAAEFRAYLDGLPRKAGKRP